MDGKVQRADGSIILLDENQGRGDALELHARLAVQVHRARPSTPRTTRSRMETLEICVEELNLDA